MKRFRFPSVCLGAILCAALFMARAQDSPGEQFQVEKIALLNLQTDRIGFTVTPSIIPSAQVHVRTITFFGMRMNGIPVFIPPVSEELDLHAGVKASLRRPMQCTIYLRDLNSLQPLIDLVKSGKIHIEGNALVEAKLDLLPSLLLRTRTAHAPFHIDASLSLDVPGGQAAREQALTVLTVAQSGSSLLSKSLLYLLGTDATQKRLQDRFGKSVLLALSRFEMADSTHKRYPVERLGVAFRLSDKQVVTAREMIEPWRFDSDVALKLKRKELTMVENSFDLLLWPSGTTYSGIGGAPLEAAALGLRKHDFHIESASSAETETMVATNTGSRATLVNTVPRASTSNLAVLAFDVPLTTGSPVAPLDAKLNSAGYKNLAIFRFPAGAYTKNVEPEIVRLSASSVNGRLVFDDPVDSSAFGSPVISDTGLVGIVQDENSAIGLETALPRLKLATGK